MGHREKCEYQCQKCIYPECGMQGGPIVPTLKELVLSLSAHNQMKLRKLVTDTFEDFGYDLPVEIDLQYKVIIAEIDAHATTHVVDMSPRRYVILEGIEYRNKFFSHRNVDQTPEQICMLDDGKVAYQILGYCDTIYGCQMFLFGSSEYKPSDLK